MIAMTPLVPNIPIATDVPNEVTAEAALALIN